MNKVISWGLGFLLLPVLAFANTKDDKPHPQQQQPKQWDITPANGPLDHHSFDVVLDAEFLWWYARLTNFSYANRDQILLQGGNPAQPTRTDIQQKKIFNFDTDWAPGLRLGLGFVTNHDGWDVYCDWTWFYNSERNSKRVPEYANSNFSTGGLSPGTNLLSSIWFTDGNFQKFNHIKGRWSLVFNQVDLEVGRKFWISKRLSLRPHTGLRGHWSRTFLRITGVMINEADGFNFESVNFKQKLWAIGLLAGINSAWHMTKNWSVFADFDTALVYGKYHVRRNGNVAALDSTQSPNLDANFSTKLRYHEYVMQPVFDLALGFRYETTLYNETYRLMLDLGWEDHLWIDFNRMVINAEDIADGNLSLNGIVFRGRFEF